MKKKIILLLLIISILSITGCKKEDITSYKTMDGVIYSGILNQKYDQYYVIFYATGCTYCEELSSTVITYANYSKNKKSAIPIFSLNLSEKRVNSGINSTSDDEYDDFIHTNDYTKIRFTNAPGIILVKNGQVEKYISSKTTLKPMSEIKALLEAAMK